MSSPLVIRAGARALAAGVALAAGAWLTACGATPSPSSSTSAAAPSTPAPSAPASASVSPAPTATTAATTGPALPAGVPDTPAGRQLAWLLDVLAHAGVTDRAAIEARFAPGLLARMSAEQALRALPELARHTAGMTISSVTAPDAEHVIAHAAAAEGRFALVVDVDPATQRITRLDVTADTGPRPRSIDDAIAQLRALAPTSQLLVAELRGGACVPLHAWNADADLAIASQFKLYVLLGLADRIRAGEARWDDELTVRADWRSLPGGVTQDDPPGLRLTLRTLAERMIAISDNTAADHLLYTVGRDRVEAAMRAARHAHPARNIPWLGTRELFWFKLEMSRADIDRYFQLATPQRRKFLDGLAGKQPRNPNDFWQEPREIDRVEWFASSRDLCRVMAALKARADHPALAPLLGVLGKNPGLELRAAGPWRYAGFKGGSEPGAVGATWLLQRDDGRWFVIHLGANAPHPLDEGIALGIAYGVIDLLAAER